MKNNFNALHEIAVQISKAYLKSESDLIAVLREIDDCRGYREMGFKSLFDYAAQGLGLSESVSFNFITIARKSKEVPKLQEMIQRQEITVSNARMVASVLTSENQDRWLSSAAELSKRELEKEIAKEFPEKQVQERTRYVSEKRIELKMGISEDLHELLKHVQDLVSSQTGKPASLEETLRAALELYVEKKDPQKKAERIEKRESLKSAQQERMRGETGKRDLEFHESVPGQANLRYIPAHLEHAVRLRDQGRCTHQMTTCQRCAEKRWLEIHHIKPMSWGGATTFENLTLICRGHHQLLHHSMH